MPISQQSLFSRKELRKNISEGESTISAFKKAINASREALKQHYHNKESASDLVRSLSGFMDKLLKEAWKEQKHLLPENKDVCLMATGGYGRGELHPYSDIDIQIVINQENYESFKEFTEAFVRFLWDIGLEVGHSLRSVKDCVKESKADITVMTNLLEARYLLGDQKLFDLMDEKIRSPRLWSPDKFFTGKLEEQVKRHSDYNDTAYNLEPNLKEGPGGLRDLQTILWVYNRRYGCRNYKDLKDLGFLKEQGITNFVRNRNVLWRMRFGLHFLNNRREDRLLFDNQRLLAKDYGFEDSEDYLAVEQLMKRYYRTVKDISLQNELLLERYRLDNTKAFQLKQKPKQLNNRFALQNKFIQVINEDVFKKSPFALLEIFLLMQVNQIDRIHPDTIRNIRYNLPLINSKFRNDIRCTSLFIEIFRQPTGLTHTLRRMNTYGVLGAYLPAFGKIVGQMQHDLFHVYTVDAHTLMLIRNIRRLTTHPDEFPLATKILQNLYKPERLYLAGLFHDIAKGRGGDHSELGAVDAYVFCIHHGLSEYDAKLVAWVVEKHLYMSHFSQRRDISDPEVVKEFAEQIGDIEHLDYLYLLTMADIRATSPKVWNAWKGQLLKDLYHATRRILHHGGTKAINAEEHINDDKNLALLELRKSKISIDNVQHFWNTLPDEYFLRFTPELMVWHLKNINNYSVLDMPIVASRFSKRYEANQFFFFAPETQWFLSEVTASLEQAEVDIFEASIHSTNAGFGMYHFTCNVSQVDLAQQKDYLAHLVKEIRNSILFGQNNRSFKRNYVSRALKHFPIKPAVRFFNQNDNHTTMEVIAQDQPGLLNKVAVTLLENNIKLTNARIATFGERAEDVFFICSPDNKPITDKTIQKELANAIYEKLDSKVKKNTLNSNIQTN